MKRNFSSIIRLKFYFFLLLTSSFLIVRSYMTFEISLILYAVRARHLTRTLTVDCISFAISPWRIIDPLSILIIW